MRSWRQSVRPLLAAIADRERGNCRLVRFEDLASDPRQTMSQLLAFLGLDPALYPFSRIAEVHVIGSSSFGREAGEAVHWDPVPRDPSFDPMARAQAWPRYRLKRFAWLAGTELSRLGYPVQRLNMFDRLGNAVYDIAHALLRGVIQIGLLPLRSPQLFSDRRRRYLCWRRMTRPGDAVTVALRNWRHGAA
jgi:hypothetical protein